MAMITSNNSTKIYQIKGWLGLNESPDGDTGLKMGEAAQMRNFRITKENHLQVRPGYATKCEISSSPIRGLWCGYVNGAQYFLAACNGHLWEINTITWAKTDLGTISDGATSFFGFSKSVYILTGSEYYKWTGTGSVQVVEGYIPIVTTAAPPAGGGTLLERVNLLTGKKRAEYSPDGEATVFQLPENSIDEVISVTGTDITYTSDLTLGTLTFSSAPPQGVNTISIMWRKGSGTRNKVCSMRFSEFYNGASDSRVFLYGDGTNEAIYSGLDENGAPTAEYFPDLNVMEVGEANTPITAMIRHYDRLLVFKTDSAFSAQYSTLTLSDSLVTAAFYCTPLNRDIGCAALGQVRLVSNNPRTIFGRACYEWTLANSATRDERNAKRISDRIEATLSGFHLQDAITFDDEQRQEYYIVYDGKAAVHHYGCNAWYYYDNFPASCLESVDGEIYFGTTTGNVVHFSNRYRNDDLEEINAYWESGAMDFDMDWKRKASSTIWVSIKPESQARITVTAQSNVKSNYTEKEVAAGLSSFVNTSFAHWSFGTNRKPQVYRQKIKVKKFTFYKLIFRSNSASSTATILATDFQIRYVGNVK